MIWFYKRKRAKLVQGLVCEMHHIKLCFIEGTEFGFFRPPLARFCTPIRRKNNLIYILEII